MTSKVDLSQKPYYDDYDPTKNYTQILAVPGRIEQAREFTQMQTMFYDMLKRVSDTLLKDGSIVSGMSFSLDGGNVLTVEDGNVYIEGRINRFEKQTIQMTGTGEEIIGIKMQDTIITEEQDGSLRGPAPNMEDYGQPGAHRIQSKPVLTLNDDTAAVLFQFKDGQLEVAVSKPNFSGLQDVLAKRTYDESGNYRVNGLQLRADPLDADNVQLTVEAGTAYVMGYQIIKPTPIKVQVPVSKDLRLVQNEPKTFTTGTTQYALNNGPAESITNVIAEVQVSETVTRGGVAGGIDYLANSPVVSIESVTAGATTYIQGTDYQLTTDGVDWSLAGTEPAAGTTYTAVYRYNKTMVQGTDYQLTSSTDAFGTTTYYIEFLAGGDVPVNGSEVLVNYNFYLARKDLISIDKSGNIIVITGQSDITRIVKPPIVNDPEQLILGTIYLPPDGTNATTDYGTITRMEMGDLQHLSDRVDELEYNQAVSALDREAMGGENPPDLKGIFSDNFRSTDKGDLTNPNFSAAYSLEDGVMRLPISTSNVFKPSINTGASSIQTWGRLIAAPMVEILSIDQFYATTTKLINPYLAFNSAAVMKLDPEVDSWVDNTYFQIQKTEAVTENFYRWWRHPPGRKAWDEKFYKNAIVTDGQGSLESWRPKWHGTSRTVTMFDKSRKIIEEAITYMRQITVSMHCENLVPDSDNLIGYFDGIQVPLTATNGTAPGSTTGTVKSTATGVVDATFTIPAGVRTGTREVELKNANNYATAPFTAHGTHRITEDTIIRKRVTLYPVDPLAQTFQFDKDTVVTSIGAYFAYKDPTSNVVVQIRNVVSGYPSDIVYAEKVLTPSDIQQSADATLETKITFDDPIYCDANTQYCMVFVSDSSTDSMYIADLGSKDVTTGNLVQRQPYLAGMLFSSSNGIAWTAHQSQNLKFRVYTAQFNSSGTILFDPITNINASTILLLADYLTPKNTGCVWQVSIDDGAYQPIASYEELDASSVVSKVQLKATFDSNPNVSPLITKDSFSLVGFLSSTSASYIGKNLDLAVSYTDVKQVFDGYIPPGSSITPQFSYDDGTTWVTPTLTDSYAVSSDYTRYTYETTVPSGDNALQFRARLNFTANSAVLSPKAQNFMNIMK